MKNIQHTMFTGLRIFYGVFTLVCFGLSMPAWSQTGSEEPKKEEVTTDTTAASTEEAAPEKLALRMSFESFTVNGEVKLVARVRSKVGEKFQNTAGVEISFYKNEIAPENLIGKDTSNRKGEAYWYISPGAGKDSSAAAKTFWAAVQNHPDYEDAQETVDVMPSKMDITLDVVDSVRTVTVFVGHPDETGAIVPLPEVECKVYVQRMFGVMPIGDPATTDENGNITVEFPEGIKGDEAGNVMVVARIVGNEVIGNVEVSKPMVWGIPTKVDNFYLQRELWSARANSPLILIFVVNIVLIGIWGTIAFIFLEIFRINKLGKTN
jgi:hypothetical protein